MDVEYLRNQVPYHTDAFDVEELESEFDVRVFMKHLFRFISDSTVKARIVRVAAITNFDEQVKQQDHVVILMVHPDRFHCDLTILVGDQATKASGTALVETCRLWGTSKTTKKVL